ncbi:M23 family metallopeptidase [Candidatus Sumerlaeota bacterium]|nr:M23 family metallopeptidase [Candidatus Sumerlaeota bacterium]
MKKTCVFLLVLFLSSVSSLAFPQASPGPYEILPVEEAFITEALKDLLATTERADWSGYLGTTWISPNAYNGHEGTDFSLDTGTPILAPANGTVIDVVTDIPENNHTINSFGNYVLMQVTGGVSPQGESLDIILCHLLPNVPVTIGQNVTTGQVVGYADNTGNSTSEHIHIEPRLRDATVGTCPFYWGHWKYPIMFNPNGVKQVGHVIRVKIASTPVRSDMYETSSQITTAYQNQLFFSSFWKRGYYRVFIPNDASNRSGWIKAIDAEEVFTGTVIQAIPDPGTYVHNATLISPYAIKASPDAGSATIGQIVYGGGRFVADQVQSGWYRIPVPGSASWGWVQPDSRMIVYPQLYNSNINPANLPDNDFPLVENFSTVGKCLFGRSKYNRSFTQTFTPSSPGGDGIVVRVTDANTYGNGYEECVVIGKVDHRDYFVQSDVYLDYKPSYLGKKEYQIYGIFIRDDGFSSMDRTFEGKGNCYAIIYDDVKGEVRAGKYVDAAFTDFLSSPVSITEDGWHTFKIEAQGNHIRYYLDANLLIDKVDDTFISGPCGLGYSNHADRTYPAARGAYFDNFVADELGAPTPTPTPTPTGTPTPTPTPTATPGGKVYVHDIAMSSGASGPNYFGIAAIWIKNDSGADVSGAKVTGEWSGAVSGTSSGITGADGKVALQSSKKKNGGTFTFCVTNVEAAGYIYDSNMNVETCDSITAP